MTYDPNNTYCTVKDVAKRLTRFGVVWAADVDSFDNDLDSKELEYIYDAIEYANNLVDAAVFKVRSDITKRPCNPWCRDRAIDIACFRLVTLSGRDAPVVLQDDYVRARDDLNKVKLGDPIPGLTQSLETAMGHRSYNVPFAINPRRAR